MDAAALNWVGRLDDPLKWAFIAAAIQVILVVNSWYHARPLRLEGFIASAVLTIGLYESYDMIWNLLIMRDVRWTPVRAIWIATIALVALVAAIQHFWATAFAPREPRKRT